MTLQDTVRYFTEETEILPCLSVTCGGAGLCVQARGGVINEQGTPVSDRTLFDLASLTKLFTGLLTMRLWEEGRLDLTRPVTDYAPQYRYLSDMPVEKVLGFEIGLTTPERIDTQKTPEAAKQQLWAVQPGEIRGRAYSDIHAMVIRDVIEGAAQSGYGAELTRCILRPLEMAETFLHVPEERRMDCISCRGEHRIEQGKHILRTDAQPGIPHDPKAAKLYPEIMGHAGLFSTQGDMVKFAQGVLREQVISKMTIRKMARNRTGFRRADGTYQQYLGALCYVKHPVQYFSEIPAYESDEAIGLAGFTGQHMSIDIGTGVFTLFLGNRVMNRLTVLVPEAGKSLTDYGLQADGRGWSPPSIMCIRRMRTFIRRWRTLWDFRRGAERARHGHKPRQRLRTGGTHWCGHHAGEVGWADGSVGEERLVAIDGKKRCGLRLQKIAFFGQNCSPP